MTLSHVKTKSAVLTAYSRKFAILMTHSQESVLTADSLTAHFIGETCNLVQLSDYD